MDIYCNENHDMVRKSVRDFAEKVIKPPVGSYALNYYNIEKKCKVEDEDDPDL